MVRSFKNVWHSLLQLNPLEGILIKPFLKNVKVRVWIDQNKNQNT